MSDITIQYVSCDECGKVEERYGRYNWFDVRIEDDQLYQIGGPDLVGGNFCCISHLLTFYNKLAAERVKVGWKGE